MMNSVQADIFIQGTKIRSLYGSDKHLKQLLMRYIALSFYLLIFFSCASQKKEIIAKSIIKLEGKDTSIRDLIEIDGYYSKVNMANDVNSNIMFFEDGTYVNFGFKEGVSKSKIRHNMAKSVHHWGNNNEISWGNYWGTYKIKKDTIIAYYYAKGSYWSSWMFYEIRYKVQNRITIIPIYSKGLLENDEQYDKENNIIPWINNGKELIFYPADSLPSSDNWLKENKWIWRNESDWKNYMQHVEQIKKQYKKK